MNMNELRDSDTSDGDIFIIKQNILNCLRSKRSKKENGVKLLSAELMLKSKKENSKAIEGAVSEELSKSSKKKKKSSSYVNQRNQIFKDKMKEFRQKNELKDVKGNSNRSRVQFQLEEIKIEKCSNINNNKSLPNYLPRAKIRESYLNEEHKSRMKKSRKRVELSPELFPPRKKLKNDMITPTSSLKSDKCLSKPLDLPAVFVEIHEANSSDTEKLKNEISLDNIRNDNIKNIKFEEFSASQLESKFHEIWRFYTQGQEEKYNSSSELLCFLLKKIINDETKKQVELEQKSCMNGKTFQRLISENECEVFNKFFYLEDNACKLFVRMLIRKKDWHRVSSIVYKDIGGDLHKYFTILKAVNFIDVNIENEDLETQLNLLSKPEVQKLCKSFNVCFKSHASVKKDLLIKSLVEECRKQKSVLDFMKGNNSTCRLDLLKSQIKKYMGMCIRINKETYKAFYKIVFLFSFAHYFDDKDKIFSTELFMCFRIYKNIIKFPNYRLSFCVVFETPADFDDYETSLTLLNSFEMAIRNKNHNEFITIVSKAKHDFKNILKNPEYHKRFLNLPSFLKKFNAGTVYARILTKYCQTFKRKADDSEIIETVKLLLQQDFFLQRKRGDWYEILSKALENLKENNAAAEVIINALKDPFVNEVQRLTLQLRGQGILKKKTYGITDIKIKEELDDKCTVSVKEPVNIEIMGKALDGSESGFKCVYVQDTGYGKKYLSVEEKAICYYKSLGFTRGYHVEGYIIHSIYFIIFFDIIYGSSPEGVFQSPYQEVPLDFNSASFYLNRKSEIDKLLDDLLNWDEKKVKTTIKDVYSRNYDTICIINWNNEFTPELFCEVIKCITMPILVLIFQRLLKNFRTYRSGFPDLTLWNPETNEIKFVEVKSPNDRLSPAQSLWLNYLRHIGLRAEVCNVKSSAPNQVKDELDSVFGESAPPFTTVKFWAAEFKGVARAWETLNLRDVQTLFIRQKLRQLERQCLEIITGK